MKYILTIIALCTFAFAQVPDSVIVNRIAELKVELSQNQQTRINNEQVMVQNDTRAIYLQGQIQALEALLKKEEDEVSTPE